jgi:LPXTG-motif cell wall-anchored protein
VLPIVILGYGGHRLDLWLENRQPWFLLVGAVLGIGVGFYGLWRRLVRK